MISDLQASIQAKNQEYSLLRKEYDEKTSQLIEENDSLHNQLTEMIIIPFKV